MAIVKLCLAAVLSVAGLGAPAPTTPGRGSIVSMDPVMSLDSKGVKDFLAPLQVWVPEAQHGVDSYKVTYRTVDVQGKPTTASAFVVLPQTPERRLRPAVWLHGTQSYRLDAPSVSDCCDRAAGVLFGSIGYAVTVPD